jgi:hypothetical protein
MTQEKRRPERRPGTQEHGHDARICVTVTPPPAKPPTAEGMFGAFLHEDETKEEGE